uniref:Retrotransposon gag domain-containing protein n=1 Tax=Amphimedon queenslandica TaxID=400682 RepID=A0A1X7TTF2_AMPQE
MATKPVILPEPYSGDSKCGEWDEWVIHFQNCAEVNGWDDDAKLKFLKVRLTGRAQSAFQRLPNDSKDTYAHAVEALTERFEPSSKRDLLKICVPGTRFQSETLPSQHMDNSRPPQNIGDYAELVEDEDPPVPNNQAPPHAPPPSPPARYPRRAYRPPDWLILH